MNNKTLTIFKKKHETIRKNIKVLLSGIFVSFKTIIIFLAFSACNMSPANHMMMNNGDKNKENDLPQNIIKEDVLDDLDQEFKQDVDKWSVDQTNLNLSIKQNDKALTLFDKLKKNIDQEGNKLEVSKAKESVYKARQAYVELTLDLGKSFIQSINAGQEQSNKMIEKCLGKLFNLVDDCETLDEFDTEDIRKKALDIFSLDTDRILEASRQITEEISDRIEKLTQGVDKVYETMERNHDKIMKARDKELAQDEKRFYKRLKAFGKQKDKEFKIADREFRKKSREYEKKLVLIDKKERKQLKREEEKNKKNNDLELLKLKTIAEENKLNNNNELAKQKLIEEKNRINNDQELLKLKTIAEENKLSNDNELAKQKLVEVRNKINNDMELTKQRLIEEKNRIEQAYNEQVNLEKERTDEEIAKIELKRSEDLLKQEVQKNIAAMDIEIKKVELLDKKEIKLREEFKQQLALYDKEIAIGYEFIKNQIKNSKPYNFSNNPPRIVEDNGVKTVKPGVVKWSVS